MNHVFGYGSLVHLDQLSTFLGRATLESGDYHYCSLDGFRRVWNVAMDNRVDIPGYKWYRDPHTGDRPDLRVTFVNIEQAPDSNVNGIAFGVTDHEFDLIRRRERNYDAVDISDQLDTPLPGRAWVFSAKPENIALYEEGRNSGASVVATSYHQTVESAFQSLGPDAWKAYRQSTHPIDIPIRDLVTVPIEHDPAP